MGDDPRAPEDYLVVGFRPVSSRTYLAVRTSAFLIHAAEVATLTRYIPVVAFLTHDGISWSLASGAIVAVAATTFATTMTVVLVYGWLFERLGAARMRRVVNYAAAVIGIFMMAGMGTLWFAFVDVGDSGLHFSVRDVELPRAPWVLAYPGT